MILELIVLSGFIVFLESIGRNAASDLHDLAILAAITPLIAFAIYFHLKRHSIIIGQVIRLARGIIRRIKKMIQIEVGADFRNNKGEYLSERRPYIDLRMMLLIAVLFNVSIIPFYESFPDVVRTLKRHLFYTPYLAISLIIWTVLIGAIFLDFVILAVLLFHYVLKSPFYNPLSHPRGRDIFERVHSRRLLMFLSLIGGLGLIEFTFGKTGWFWLMVFTAALSFSLAFIPRANETVMLLIKRNNSPRLQSISITEWNFSFFAVVQTLGLGVFVLTTGAGWGSEGTLDDVITTMPCTYYSGRLFGAITSLATLFYFIATLDFLDIKRMSEDPTLPREKTLYYREGSLPGGLKIKGWNLASVTWTPERDEADLYYDMDRSRAMSAGIPALSKDLLRIAPEDRPFYLDRTDFIAKRRIFYRGLSRLLKICRASRFRDGAGFILIPQCYFVEGLHRDDRNEHMEEDRLVGPCFQDLWGLRVRHFLHRVLEAMDIDIIYFEDGVSFKELRGVFETLFELYHARGPRFRVEDYHFTGLTGVRVLMEYIRPDLPRNGVREGYPETNFTNLSQARILMVYKDRGGETDLKPEHEPGIGLDIPAFF